MSLDVEPFFVAEESVSPGGKATIGIRDSKGTVLRYCIGSGDGFREAKACAIRNLRQVLEKVKGMEEPTK